MYQTTVNPPEEQEYEDTIYPIYGDTQYNSSIEGRELNIHRLDKPYTDEESADFIIQYNHQQGMKIEETDTALYALENCQIMKDGVPVLNQNYGSGEDDIIIAGNDDSTMYGLDGDDYLRGSNLDDTIYGGTGSDVIYGRDGNDNICGEEGDDIIFGGDGDDTIYGGSGNDVINTGAGNNTIYAESGNDKIICNGNNTLYLSSGNDTIISESGNTNIIIEYGSISSCKVINNDFVIYYGNGSSIKLADYISNTDVYAVKTITVNDRSKTYNVSDLYQTTVNPPEEQEYEGTIYPIYRDTQYIGTDNDDFILDSITCNSNIEKVHLLKGNDIITIPDGGLTNAIVYGDDGNDRIMSYGENTNNTLIGGRGNDYIEVVSSEGNHTNTLIFNNGDGHDYLDCENSTIKFADTTLDDLDLEYYGAGIEYYESYIVKNLLIKYNSELDSVLLNIYDDIASTITITDKNGDEILLSDLILQRGEIPVSTDTQLIGTDGDDYIRVHNPNIEEVHLGDGNDNFGTAGQENVIIYGENGNDYISAEACTIIGGKGNDTMFNYSLEHEGTFVLNKGDGNDFIYTSESNSIIKFADSSLSELSLETVGDSLVIKYNSGSDSVLLQGSPNSVTLSDKNNTNISLLNFITQYGSILEYSDAKILGTNGNDIIYSSNDGPNFIQGGTGNDIYNVASLDNYVNIFDASGENDVININANKDDLVLKFDLRVDNEGNIINDSFKSMYITNISDFTNYYSGIKVANQFINGHEIEKITTADNYSITVEKINELRENIAGWLHDNGFESVQQVINSDENDNINNLMAQFQTADWQAMN